MRMHSSLPKIASRAKALLATLAMTGTSAVIAAEGAGKDEILVDIRYLRRLWEQIAAQMKTASTPTVIYEDLSLALRTLRDLVNPKIEPANRMAEAHSSSLGMGCSRSSMSSRSAPGLGASIVTPW